MALTLVKKLSYLQEEQKHSQTYLEIGNLRLLRGSLTEFTGETSTGKTSLVFMLLSALTQKGEICAVVDLNNSFNPQSAKACNIVLENLLWIKCGGNVEHAFRSVDHLIQAKNFGMIWMDLSDDLLNDFRFIPSSYWYRFRTRIKDSQTILITTPQRPLMGSASNQAHRFDRQNVIWSGHGRFKLIKELQIDLSTSKPFFVQPEFIRIEARY